MSMQPRVSNTTCCSLPTEVEGFGLLAELALDMRWSWNHYADEMWRQLDPVLWQLTQNPWVVLQTVSRDKLRHMLAGRPDSLTLAVSRTSGNRAVSPLLGQTQA
jgi:starch phosphorylase